MNLLAILCFYDSEPYAWLGAGIITILLVVLAIAILPYIFYLLTLQKALQRCAPQNRAMDPALVWLMLIPLFNLVWQFIVVSNIATSLGNEFRSRNMQREAEPGKSLGIAYCILLLCGIIPFLGIIASLAGFICWIMYWVKIANYSSEISQPPQTANPYA